MKGKASKFIVTKEKENCILIQAKQKSKQELQELMVKMEAVKLKSRKQSPSHTAIGSRVNSRKPSIKLVRAPVDQQAPPTYHGNQKTLNNAQDKAADNGCNSNAAEPLNQRNEMDEEGLSNYRSVRFRMLSQGGQRGHSGSKYNDKYIFLSDKSVNLMKKIYSDKFDQNRVQQEIRKSMIESPSQPPKTFEEIVKEHEGRLVKGKQPVKARLGRIPERNTIDEISIKHNIVKDHQRQKSLPILQKLNPSDSNLQLTRNKKNLHSPLIKQSKNSLQPKIAGETNRNIQVPKPTLGTKAGHADFEDDGSLDQSVNLIGADSKKQRGSLPKERKYYIGEVHQFYNKAEDKQDKLAIGVKDMIHKSFTLMKALVDSPTLQQYLSLTRKTNEFKALRRLTLEECN